MKVFIKEFDRQFAAIDAGYREILSALPNDRLFQKIPSAGGRSAGELILRGAGKIEQTFGGLSSRLWDDPFEWTLPEEVSTKNKVFEYLDEVERTRRNGFGYFANDDELKRELPAPEKMITIFELLIETMISAAKLQTLAESALSETLRESE